MGSLQSVFLSSAAMTLTRGIWETLLRHLQLASVVALLPHHNRGPSLGLCPRGSVPSWALPWRLAQVLGLHSCAAHSSLSGWRAPGFHVLCFSPRGVTASQNPCLSRAPGPPSRHPCLHTSFCRLLAETSWTPGRIHCPCALLPGFWHASRGWHPRLGCLFRLRVFCSCPAPPLDVLPENRVGLRLGGFSSAWSPERI